MSVLTPRETEVLSLYARGERGHDIAAALDISYETVRSHATNIRVALGARTIAQACAMWAAVVAQDMTTQLLRSKETTDG